MDSQFYRPEQPRQTALKWLKKLWKKKRVRLAFLILLPAVSFVLFSNRGVLQRISLEAEKKELEKQVAEAQKKHEQLLQLYGTLESDPKIMEKIAREKYGMVKAGETVYRLQPKQ